MVIYKKSVLILISYQSLKFSIERTGTCLRYAYIDNWYWFQVIATYFDNRGLNPNIGTNTNASIGTDIQYWYRYLCMAGIFGSCSQAEDLEEPSLLRLLTGTGVVILSPTRELAMQTYGVLKELMTHHVHTYGLIMGGSNRSAEAQKLANGVNILVATPGRLLDHLQASYGSASKLI